MESAPDLFLLLSLSVKFSHSVMFDCVTPWIAACQASLSITNSRSSLKFTSIESVMPSSHFILCRPLLLLSPIPPSIRVFSNESTLCMRWPKYCSCSFSIIPSKEHPGLSSFRMDWFDLLAVQGTLRSLLQHHNLKVSILQHSVFFNYPWTQSSIAPGHPLSRDSRENLILTSFRCCWLPVVFGLWSSSSVSVLCLHVAFFCVCQIPLYSLL